LGIGPHPQPPIPIPNPQSPIPNPQLIIFKKNKNNLKEKKFSKIKLYE